jgi:L-ascorbate metabolism protein UlaG (beta-lactamase superfamily)
MQDILRAWKLDLAFLPINGRDARRLKANCIGNMTYQEAADLAGALKPRVVVPAHYDMFEFNSANPDDFVEYVHVKYPRQRLVAPRHGERVLLKAAGN